MLLKLIVKDSDKRINWDDYFNHPFNSLQIIQIYVNTEKDNSNTKILDKDFEIEQLKDATIFIDENKDEIQQFIDKYLFFFLNLIIILI